ncbi:uncharacterized protein LOC104869320 [Fukomys damarensis]|uniref:uncharacterized protein LOC104869320 n=1 Tax=Fukomys damarensis TaxID=885580 RepID=UPI0005400BE2|nr:uncharacterized protein LOC104869320 [Fukomys damarensis]
MLFGQSRQREGLKTLYVAHLFVLAGVVYYYFQTSVERIAPEIAGESSQSTGKTLRPVWGMMMDKCYPETTQAISPRATGRRNDSAPKELTDTLPQEEEQEKKKVQQEVAEYPSGASVIDSKEEKGYGAGLPSSCESSGRTGFQPLTLPRCRAMNEKGSNKPLSSDLNGPVPPSRGPAVAQTSPTCPHLYILPTAPGHCFLPRLFPLVDTLQWPV